MTPDPRDTSEGVADTGSGRLFCCYIPEGAPEGCRATGEIFDIQLSPDPYDSTQACRAHLGELIDSVRVGQTWVSSTVVLAQRPIDGAGGAE